MVSPVRASAISTPTTCARTGSTGCSAMNASPGLVEASTQCGSQAPGRYAATGPRTRPARASWTALWTASSSAVDDSGQHELVAAGPPRCPAWPARRRQSEHSQLVGERRPGGGRDRDGRGRGQRRAAPAGRSTRQRLPGRAARRRLRHGAVVEPKADVLRHRRTVSAELVPREARVHTPRAPCTACTWWAPCTDRGTCARAGSGLITPGGRSGRRRAARPGRRPAVSRGSGRAARRRPTRRPAPPASTGSGEPRSTSISRPRTWRSVPAKACTERRGPV